ncbi:putative ammonia monooxygenase [Thermosinus carboxydivorans Nor1]|uniref:Putative ammonia monooxygenase n=1 Tax=Thermosinus carboxydivorans Nor1 TaxID=401526 RepID=A1HS75_9FIRM|nr:AbrB family transcriptional regulator [Thermosinus carboxydivorans]EAX47139.1 putative ammonia monooxygenase [Thermosinus carboxydivorans Nor1]
MLAKSFPVFFVACAGGALFSFSHIPLPWTLGPMVAAVLWKTWLKKPVYWPKKMRNIGMLVLGYVMGSPFTPETGHQIIGQLPTMLAATLLIVVVCLATSYLAGRVTGIGTANSLIGGMPGGLSQMAMICEETKGTDVSVVTIMQTIRLLTVVFTVPFVALHGIADKTSAVKPQAVPITIQDIPMLCVFFVAITCAISFIKHIRFPSPYVIGPVLGTAALTLAGIHAPVLPPPVIAAAQILVGIKMGLDLEVTRLSNWRTIALSSFASVIAAIFLLLGAAYLFSLLTSIPLITVFISMAPGGMSEMALTAMIANADLSTVVAYQLFRLLFILVVAVPTARWWLSRNEQNLCSSIGIHK